MRWLPRRWHAVDASGSPMAAEGAGTMSGPTGAAPHDPGSLLAAFSVPSTPGSARVVRHRVGEACAGLGLSPQRLDALGTAVAEATTNAIEHGNGNDASRLVEIDVWVDAQALVVRITDEGHGGEPVGEPVEPDIGAKLRGEQSPRGWGLFLIRNAVDDLRLYTDDERHIVELVLRIEGSRGPRRSAGTADG